jgi:eukaryotic-like serine/threonine-protein kinase
MQLLDAALAALAQARLFVLALARPEVRDRKPFSNRRPHELRLDPLGRRASERMVREALGPSASDDVVAGLVGRAEGNALFLEELIRAVAHHADGELPVGVIGTVQRRFDVLNPEGRAVLRAASVYGERFTASGVAALHPEHISVDASLASLVAEELISSQSDGFAFRHALVREAAYALIAAGDRVLAHALAGRHLACEGATDPAVIARHFELGNARTEAAHWYGLAAEHALERNDIAGALAHAECAQRWTDDAETLGALDLIVAEAEFWRGKLEQTRQAAQRATSRLPVASAAWFQAAGLILTSSGQLGDNQLVETWLVRVIDLEPAPEARSAYVLCLSRGSTQLVWTDRVEIARRAIARAATIPSETLGPTARARLRFALAYDYVPDGRVDRCTETLHEVAAIYERAGARRDALQMTMLGHMLSMFAGEVTTAREMLRRCVDDAERIEARYLADWARWEVSCSLWIVGERDAAEAELARVPAAMQEQPLFRSVQTMMRAWCEFHRGDVYALEQILASVPTLAYSRFRAALACFGAFVQLQRGDRPGAVAASRAALAALVSSPGLKADGALCGFAAALETLVRAEAPDAQHEVEKHVTWLEQIAAPFDASVREGFLHRVPWNHHVLALRDGQS